MTTNEKIPKDIQEMRKKKGFFICVTCGKKHRWSTFGEYHTKESAYFNNAPKWRYPKK